MKKTINKGGMMFKYIDDMLQLLGVIIIVVVGVVLVTISQVLGWMYESIKWCGNKVLRLAKKEYKVFKRGYRRGRYITTKHGKDKKSVYAVKKAAGWKYKQTKRGGKK